MTKTIVALALTAAFAAPALAQTAAPAPASPHTFTGNVGITTDYIFRGISQSQQKPAIQGGFDYSHSSGVYLGTWASNVAWVRDTGFKTNSSLELDIYGGYKWGFAPDMTLDLGALAYIYPGNKVAGAPDTDSTEIYAGLSWKFVTLKYNHTVSKNLFGWVSPMGQKSKGSGYLDLSVNYEVAEGLTLNGHVGRQKIKNFSAASYTDWKLGLTKDVGFGSLGIAYTGTTAKGSCTALEAYCWNGKDVGKDRLVLTFSKTF